MTKQKPNNSPRSKGLLDCIKEHRSDQENIDIIVRTGKREGIVHLRDGRARSANTGRLQGNGALLSLIRLESPELELSPASTRIEKTISLTLAQIERLPRGNGRGAPDSMVDEEKLLEEAVDLLHRFHHSKAHERLVTLLRANRYYYPAWLWLSRLISRQDFIGKALEEACRWGNHDRDIWHEARKIRPQLEDNSSHCRRCFFCWSPLKNGSRCGHCHGHMTITGRSLSPLLKTVEIEERLASLSQAMERDFDNDRLAYAIAIGHFNLRDNRQALHYMRKAAGLSPQTALYNKSQQFLIALSGAEGSGYASRMQQTADTTKGDTILVVDDSQTSRKVLSMLFQRIGYRTVEAASGTEAMATAKAITPKLIILDVMLPDGNGHDLLPKLRQLDHIGNIPVFILTGKQDACSRMQGMSAGASEYITKPFKPETLVSLVQRYLGGDHHPDPTKDHEVELSPRPNPGQQSILVVEDSQTSRMVVTMVLGRHGYHVHEAATGTEALAMAPKITPDLVLLDLMLPDMTGYEILPRLRQLHHYSELPIIMLTGKRDSSNRMKGMLVGTNEYMTKPFNPEKLISVIKKYI